MGNENDDSNNFNNNNVDWVSKTSKINDLRSGGDTGLQKAGDTKNSKLGFVSYFI